MKDALQKLNDREYEKLSFYREVLKEQKREKQRVEAEALNWPEKEKSMKTLGQAVYEADMEFLDYKKYSWDDESPRCKERYENYAKVAVAAWIERNAEPVAWHFEAPGIHKVDIAPHGGAWKPLFAAPQSLPSAGPTSYIQNVPDHCDRIIWRGDYYMLPGKYLKPLPSVEEADNSIEYELRGLLADLNDMEEGINQQEMVHAKWMRMTLGSVMYRVNSRISACMERQKISTSPQPLPDMKDAYVGAREDLEVWKKRALKAEKENRRLTDELMREVNGPTFMGEPVLQKATLPSVDEIASLVKEGLAWAMVYGPVIHNDQWDEMRDTKANEIAARIDALIAKGK